uniref:Ig-like domain-containing protein n=1 Tax=Chrysemys picta bellii TaxID=8478 RepID=A0A8C3ICQ8_CHRPI
MGLSSPRDSLPISPLLGSVAGNSLTQIPASLPGTEGQRVEIRCQYSTSYSNYALDWYQELPGKQPRFLRKSDSVAPRFSAQLDTGAKSLTLSIDGAQRADSAVYFCALWDPQPILQQATNNVDTDKLIFGKGTTVTVEPSKYKPKQSDGQKLTAACLAKDFYPKTIEVNMNPETDLVYKSEEGILSSNGKYSMIQVVKVDPNEEVECIVNHDGKSFIKKHTLSGTVIWRKCEFYHRIPSLLFPPAEPNMEKVNMLSVTVLGLRVLLAKSIAFNMLMTVKLFIF